MHADGHQSLTCWYLNMPWRWTAWSNSEKAAWSRSYTSSENAAWSSAW